MKSLAKLLQLVIMLTFAYVFEASEVKEHKLREMECECGVRNHDDYTVLPRGDFSENHAWPWMASIVNITISDHPVAYCGASLINDRYILTAAHCIPDMLDTGINNFRIYLGTNYIENVTQFLNLGIGEVINHPNFDFDTADNDVCLIRLSDSVSFSNDVRPICLRKTKKCLAGKHGYITGWGSYNLSEPTENALKEAKAIIVSNAICAKNYSTVDIPITKNMICASLKDEDDPCKGDSGGPLIIKEKNADVYTQVGIISHGEGCSTPDYPSIFSRVSSFIDWIKENTKDAIYCPSMIRIRMLIL